MSVLAIAQMAYQFSCRFRGSSSLTPRVLRDRGPAPAAGVVVLLPTEVAKAVLRATGRRGGAGRSPSGVAGS